MDTLAQLSQEHDALRIFLERIEAAAEARDTVALSVSLEVARAALTTDLDAHISVEEAEAFSPIAEALGVGLVAPFYEEHVEIRATRDEVYTRLERDEAPYAQALRLCDLILAHQQREDLMLFPSAREVAFR